MPTMRTTQITQAQIDVFMHQLTELVQQPGDAAAVAIAAYVMICQECRLDKPGLEQIAEEARRMVLSFRRGDEACRIRSAPH